MRDTERKQRLKVKLVWFFLLLISVIIHLSGRLYLVITNIKSFWHAQDFFFIFWKNLFPMGKRKSNIINISVFLLPCLQLWRQNSAGRCVLLPPLVEVRWPQWEVLQPSLCIESSSREMDKNCPQVLTHCPIHPPAKGIHSDLC